MIEPVANPACCKSSLVCVSELGSERIQSHTAQDQLHLASFDPYIQTQDVHQSLSFIKYLPQRKALRWPRRLQHTSRRHIPKRMPVSIRLGAHIGLYDGYGLLPLWPYASACSTVMLWKMGCEGRREDRTWFVGRVSCQVTGCALVLVQQQSCKEIRCHSFGGVEMLSLGEARSLALLNAAVAPNRMCVGEDRRSKKPDR